MRYLTTAAYKLLLKDASPQLLATSSLIGVAALIYGLYRYNYYDGREALQAALPDSTGPVGTESRNSAFEESSPVASAVHKRLDGQKCISMSCVGVLLNQKSSADLQEGADVVDGVEQLVRAVASCSNLYLIAHVEDDIGEAAVQGALQASGIVGSAPDQVPPHRLIFCSTHVGKVSIVRQLEPDMHIDGSITTIEELQRFVPGLLHISSSRVESPTAFNVKVAQSLSQYFLQ